MNFKITLLFKQCIVWFVLVFTVRVKGENDTPHTRGYNSQPDILMVVHDAGESLGLQPVVDFLIGNTTVQTSVLCLGEPSTSIFEGYSNSFTLQDVGITTPVVDGNDGREQVLSDADLNTLVGSVAPRVVLCGMVYAMEAQICEALKQTAYSMSFFDSFAVWSPSSISALYFTTPTPEPVREVLTSAEDTATSINSQVSPLCTAVATGNPTLNSWQKDYDDIDTRLSTRRFLYGNCSGSEDIVGVVYAGGYGTADYQASLAVFCEAASKMGQSVSNSSMRFVFSPHPGYSSEYEAALFAEWGCLDDVLVLSEDSGLTTAQVIVASNVSLSECSTVGGQSEAVSIPHAYLVADSKSQCADVFTENGLIPVATDSVQLVDLLDGEFKESGYYVSPEVLEKAGVPTNGTAAILVELHRALDVS